MCNVLADLCQLKRKVADCWLNRQGFASLSLVMVMLPALVTWAGQYIVLQGVLYIAQREAYSAVYDSERVGAVDMDPISYLSGSPALIKAAALTDVQSALAVNLANVIALSSKTLAAGVFNPGETDTLASPPAPVTDPTIHVKGVVNVNLYGGQRQIAVDAVHILRHG